MDFLGLAQLLVAGATALNSALPIQPTKAASVRLAEPKFGAVNLSQSIPTSVPKIYTAEYSLNTAYTIPEIKDESLKIVAKPNTEVGIWVATSSAVVTKKAAGPSLPKPSPSPKVKLLKVESSESGEVKGDETSEKKDGSPFDLPVKALVSSLNPENLMGLINKHREEIGLPMFEKDDKLCSLAQYRAPMLNKEIFGSGVMHAGLKALNLPFWITENIAGYDSEAVIFKFWMSDYIHKKAIESDNKYSCGACSGNNCAVEFSSFVPK